MKITIAGFGFVGKAHRELLKKKHDVTIYDPAQGYKDFGTPDCVIICVSTPTVDGECDMRNVEDVIRQTAPKRPILIKSTICIKGWDHIISETPEKEICFSPEFLRANTAVGDLKAQKEILMGGKGVDFWTNIFDCDIVVADPRALVIAKYFRNAFLATKVNFFNQIFDLCEKLNLNYEDVRKYVAQDSRIGDSHTMVTDERGFGGHCFPKDVQALLKTAEEQGIELSLIKEANEYNKKIK